ncbi:tripartite tricarboxylate transporter substrate binding protein [Ideonella azotifigens]|nr:tripartite tricarboxylate transporter substrate binding protein [Ideonella azotifigens]MCD2342923.1 tripartite tricarboxylate transporter substrate binding protein [Ideonella azotifigens]
MIKSFEFSKSAAVLALVGLSSLAHAEWPLRPIQIYVGFSPGGAADILGRALAESMSKTLGQPVIVQNRDGASGTIATNAVAKSQANGYTLGFGPVGPLVLQPHLKHLPYKPEDLTGVCQTFVNNYALAAPANTKLKSVREVVAAASAAPDGIAYGTGGIGSFPHLATIQLAQKAKVDLRAVPYRGDPPLILALKAGEVQIGTVSVGQAQAQGLPMLGVFSPNRLPEAPGVPTMTEQGFPVVAQLFGGLYAPKGTPPAILKALENACQIGTKDEKYLISSKTTQQDVVFKTAADFSAAIAHESQIQQKAVKSADLKIE